MTVVAEDNPARGTDAGNDTQDKVFLLSISEAGKYFDVNSADFNADSADSYATAYAQAQGVLTRKSSGACLFWLRSPGSHHKDATNCFDEGSDSNYYGTDRISFVGIGVRPAMWIELD